MKNTATKLYYTPVEGGRFEVVPTKEYVQPKKRHWLKDEDPITRALVWTIGYGLFAVVVVQVALWLARMGW
jgi:hypothetical protein